MNHLQTIIYSSTLLLWLLFSSHVMANDAKQKLVLLSWSEYISSQVVKRFERLYDVQLKILYYDTEDDRDQKLALSHGRGYDLILSSAARIRPYIRKNWLVAIDNQLVPNRRFIDSRWLSINQAVDKYCMPYFWGTLGIAYRRDLIKQPITSWKQLLTPQPAWYGKILMIKDHRDVIGAALKSLGFSLNSRDHHELKLASELLYKQKPSVFDYGYMELSKASGIVTGNIWISMIYNGDALALQKYNNDIKFVVPKEGTNLWLDCMTVSTYSKQRKLAFTFLNFINQPENAAQNSKELHYATPNFEARKQLPESFTNDRRIYPDPQTLARSELYQALPAKTVRRYNAIFSKLIH